MAWSGGTYSKGNSATGGWAGDAWLGIGIEAGRHDTQDNDFATGINQCLNKDGSNSATGNLNVGGYKITNMATGTASGDAVTLGQAQAGINTQSTTLAITNTRFSADTTPAAIYLQKSRGATVGTNTIVQSGDALGGLYFNGANGTGYSNAASIIASCDGTPGATNDMPGALRFYTTADGSGTLTERMIIKNDGKIGIGTSAPVSDIEIQGTGTIITNGRYSNDTSGARFDFQKSRGATVGTNTIVQSGDLLGQINWFGANGTTFTVGASVRASVDGTPGATNDMPGRLEFHTTADGAGSLTERMRITNAGRIGFGSTTPGSFVQITNNESAVINSLGIASNVAGDKTTHAITVVKKDNDSTTGQVYVSFLMNGGVTGSGQINANGASAAAFGSFSDARLKENITDLPSQLDNVLALRPVEFDYKDGSGHQIGFIAQEVEDIYPDLVSPNADGYLMLTDMNKNDARLIKAIQELHAKVEALTDRIAALEA